MIKELKATWRAIDKKVEFDYYNWPENILKITLSDETYFSITEKGAYCNLEEFRITTATARAIVKTIEYLEQ